MKKLKYKYDTSIINKRLPLEMSDTIMKILCNRDMISEIMKHNTQKYKLNPNIAINILIKENREIPEEMMRDISFDNIKNVIKYDRIDIFKQIEISDENSGEAIIYFIEEAMIYQSEVIFSYICDNLIEEHMIDHYDMIDRMICYENFELFYRYKSFKKYRAYALSLALYYKKNNILKIIGCKKYIEMYLPVQISAKTSINAIINAGKYNFNDDLPAIEKIIDILSHLEFNEEQTRNHDHISFNYIIERNEHVLKYILKGNSLDKKTVIDFDYLIIEYMIREYNKNIDRKSWSISITLHTPQDTSSDTDEE